MDEAAVRARIKEELLRRNIRLWSLPYYDIQSLSSSKQAIDEISEGLAMDFDFDGTITRNAIQSFQDVAVAKLHEVKFYDEDIKPIIQAQVADNTVKLFDVSKVPVDSSLKFYEIQESICHFSGYMFHEPVEPPRICSDYKKFRCSPEVCARFRECIECTNCGPHCQNRAISRGQFVDQTNLEVRLTNSKGYCLFTLADIQEGTMVIEYTGLLKSLEYYNYYETTHFSNSPAYYGFKHDDEHVIDAREFGNKSRFIAHGCDPNLESELWAVGTRRRVVFRALTDIPAGSELTFDYGHKFHAVQSFACNCGYEHCRGNVGGKFTFTDRVYRCIEEGCTKVYKEQSSLKNHTEKTHCASWKRCCFICGAEFRTLWGCSKHMEACFRAEKKNHAAAVATTETNAAAAATTEKHAATRAMVNQKKKNAAAILLAAEQKKKTATTRAMANQTKQNADARLVPTDPIKRTSIATRATARRTVIVAPTVAANRVNVVAIPDKTNQNSPTDDEDDDGSVVCLRVVTRKHPRKTRHTDGGGDDDDDDNIEEIKIELSDEEENNCNDQNENEDENDSNNEEDDDDDDDKNKEDEDDHSEEDEDDDDGDGDDDSEEMDVD